ncbi:MAG TPA: polyprenyl diphosphate synthase [Solirubrobacteraceae bacterium]|jgi:undecaprenyl diphosphate synthase|nr:polyprenyl diphosphate synthase [Solirubrobacteraceae bacterium]
MRAEESSASRPAARNGNTSPGGAAHHVAIVSDGSARWAQARGLSISEGHDAAADTVIARIADAIELGVEELTLFAFSTENWSRPAEEVGALLGMLARRITADTPRLEERGVRVRFIGRRDRAGDELAGVMQASERRTAGNERLRVYVAFDYGGRDEILTAAARYGGGGEAEFAKLLSCGEMHDPDLVIRTSGEQRLSNFLLWQAAYSELVFRAELWPDFGRAALEECLVEYAARRRRFGGREPDSTREEAVA